MLLIFLIIFVIVKLFLLVHNFYSLSLFLKFFIIRVQIFKVIDKKFKRSNKLFHKLIIVYNYQNAANLSEARNLRFGRKVSS